MKSILECNNPAILQALQRGTAKFKMTTEKNLVKARHWVNKNLPKQIERAAARGQKSFFVEEPWFINLDSLLTAYQEYDFLKSELYDDDDEFGLLNYIIVKWN